MDKKEIATLEKWVKRFKETPGVLKVPELSFFLEFLQEYSSSLHEKVAAADDGFFDDSIPPPLEDVDPSPAPAKKASSTKKTIATAMPTKPTTDSKTECKTEGKSTLLSSLPAIDRSVVVSPAMRELAQEEKGKGIQSLKKKQFEKALEHFTKSIQNNPQSALLWCKRAGCFFAMNAFQSAIDDATIGIEINPDAGIAYKIRGRSLLRLGKYEESYEDLKLASRYDHDDEIDLDLKEAREKCLSSPSIQKDQHVDGKKKKAGKPSEKAPEKIPELRGSSSSRSKTGAKDSKVPEWLSEEIFSQAVRTPSIMDAFKNPRVMKAIDEIARDGSAFMKYQNDPEVLTAFSAFCGVMDSKSSDKK